MPAKLLITGANGFLGRAVAKQIRGDVESIALVRSGTAGVTTPFRRCYEDVDGVLEREPKVETVLHLAACIPLSNDPAPRGMIASNVDLVSRLVQAYPDARHVLASSVSVFGIPDSLPLTVESPSRLPSAYGLSKLAAECLVRQAPQHAVIRFSSLIGVGMKPGTFIPTAVAAAQAGHITLIGDGERMQNYLAIDDAASMCLRAATDRRSFVTLGIGEGSHRDEDVVGMLARITGASIIRKDADHCSPSFVYDRRGSIDLGPVKSTLEHTLRQMVKV